MIPGQEGQHSAEEFHEGLICGVVGCSRRARHEWAYPCAINTTLEDPSATGWIPVCDECDLRLNDVFLKAVGVPKAIRRDLMRAYRLIQADAAFDHKDSNYRKDGHAQEGDKGQSSSVCEVSSEPTIEAGEEGSG